MAFARFAFRPGNEKLYHNSKFIYYSMSKIDYSQFYVKNYLQKPPPKPPVQADPQNSKPKRKKKVWFFFIIVLLIVSLFAMNFLYEGAIFDTMLAWIKQQKTCDFYLLTKNFQEREKAYAQSLLVRQSGAGGYIFQQDDYVVIYSVYLNEEDARSVSAKNNQTKVVAKRIIIEDAIYEHICATLQQLIIAAAQLEDSSIYEAKFLEICATCRQGLSEQKLKLIADGKANDAHLGVLDLLIGGLSSLNTPAPSRTKLIGDLRYIVSSALMSMPSL